MTKIILYSFAALAVIACNSQVSDKSIVDTDTLENEVITLVNNNENNLLNRFNCPKGFKRIEVDSASYAYYLRTIPLKKSTEPVLYFDGTIKVNDNVYIAVIDQEIGKRDLQQCADACMRLRGEYLYHKKDFTNIHFNFLSDNKPRYYESYVKGNYSYSKFLSYMNYVFAFANTGSLHDELEKVENRNEIEPGNILIQKRTPYGHAMTVMDVAKNEEGEIIYLLSQSYMPAQETQIVINPSDSTISPWYKLEEGEIITPEWQFSTEDLRKFPNQ